MINIWPHLKYPSAVLGWLRPYSLVSECVNFLAPEHKITLKENICFPKKFCLCYV